MYLLNPPDVPPVPNVHRILNSSKEFPSSCNCWSISAPVIVLCAFTFKSLSYCSGQKQLYFFESNFAKLIMSCLPNSASISVIELSNILGSNPNWVNCERTLAAVAFATNSSFLPSIPGAGQISISKSIILIPIFLNSWKTPSCNFLETIVTTCKPSFDSIPNAIPKLPDVASITVWPLFIFPVLIASWMIFAAGLTLIEPVSNVESNFP